MNTFIHTFSISVDITGEECSKLYRYRWMPMNGTCKKKRYESAIIEFCDRGLQIYIMQRDVKEIQNDAEHRPFRMELIVTPYKMLHPNTCLGALTEKNEMVNALKELDICVEKIECNTGIVIRRKYVIRRVDVTCDVLTPSDACSIEIIAATKTADLPYGYHRSEPTEEECATYGWDNRNGSLFYNKKQAVYAKIYNKKENICGRKEYQELGARGLVRFELELTRKFLRREGLLNADSLHKCLMAVMEASEQLFEKYFVENLYSMPMFSVKVLLDYLDKKYGGRDKTYDKLKKFCKMAYQCKKNGVPFTAEECGMSDKAFANRYNKFMDINISPIPAEANIPYIPSVQKMLNGKVENVHWEYAKQQTRGKEVWSV